METSTAVMKVYCHTGKFSHPMIDEQLRHPPVGVSYVSPRLSPPTSVAVTNGAPSAGSLTYSGVRRVRTGIVEAIGALGVPRITYVPVPKADLLHSSRDLLINRMPWICEVEIVSALAWYSRSMMLGSHMRHTIERVFSSSHCRKILPWTEAARQSLFSLLDTSRFKHKIEVIYPCIAPQECVPRIGSDGKFVILFVGAGFVNTGFYAKGGLETLLAFDQLSRIYKSLELIMVALPPPDILEHWGSRPDIKFRSAVTNEELGDLYRRADVFVLPTHIDSLGWVYLEALSYGLPCVGTRQFAVPEIIADGVTGFLVGPANSYYGEDCLPRHERPREEGHPFIEELKQPSAEYVANLARALSLLIENPDLRRRMSAAAREEVVGGKFSISRRQASLSRVYSECYSGPRESGCKPQQ